MKRVVRVVALPSSWLTLAVAASCGAEGYEAPVPQPREAVVSCPGPEALMPQLVGAIRNGSTGELKTVVETQLIKSSRAGEPGPLVALIRSVVRMVEAAAREPAERGAARGEYCAPAAAAPPIEEGSNVLCEWRRAIDVLVPQAEEPEGLDAVALIESELSTLAGAIVGRGVDCRGQMRQAHLAVAQVIASLCAQDASCQLSHTLDLLLALTSYLSSKDGASLLDHLRDLSSKPSFVAFLDAAALSEDDAVAIFRSLLPMLSSSDSQQLDRSLASMPLPAALKDDLGPLFDDIKKIWRTPVLLDPLRKTLRCLWVKDARSDLIRLLYRLALVEHCAEFDFVHLAEKLARIRASDSRRTLDFVGRHVARALLDDGAALDSAAAVCRVVFSTVTSPVQPKSNAESVLPVGAALLQRGAIHEGLCALDALLFGCRRMGRACRNASGQ